MHVVIVVFVLLLTASSATAEITPARTVTTSSTIRNKKKDQQQQQPWDHLLYDPNPFPSIAELDASPTLSNDIQDVLNRVVGTGNNNNGVIIQRYKPQPGWLWQQWFGTVLYNSWPNALLNMAWALLFCVFCRHMTHGDFQVWKNVVVADVADQHPFIAKLAIADKIWTTLMSLTNFLLTFFVGQSYAFWRSFYSVGRSIQGRLNDIQLLLATHAARDEATGQYTPEAYTFLQTTAQQLRLFHLLHWAANAKRFRVLLTQQGWNQMVSHGIVSPSEHERLLRLDLPPTSRHYAVLQATMINITQKAVRSPNIIITSSSSNLEKLVMAEFCKLRGVCGSVADMADGRMPLAYAHFVQILVDTFLVATPIAKYASLGIFSVLMIGILTLFFHGLLILAKVFLDPLDNEDYCEGCTYLDLPVLIRESNASSKRWIDGAAII